MASPPGVPPPASKFQRRVPARERSSGSHHATAGAPTDGPSATAAGGSGSSRAGRRGLPRGTQLRGRSLVTPSGTPSLDHLLGGGLTIGTVLLVEEDVHGHHALAALRAFLATGVGLGHPLLLSSADKPPATILESLPGISRATAQPGTQGKDTPGPQGAPAADIAWRYQYQQPVSSVLGQQQQGRAPAAAPFASAPGLDFSKRLDPGTIAAADATLVDPTSDGASGTEAAPAAPYSTLLAAIQSLAARCALDPAQADEGTQPPQLAACRVAVHALGSAYYDHGADGVVALNRFLHRLRAVMRETCGVCLVTLPPHLLKASQLRAVERLVDGAICLQSFAGQPQQSDPALRDYHGFCLVKKLPCVNRLVDANPGTLDLAYRLKRKELVIQKLHLPPEMGSAVSRSQGKGALQAAARAVPSF